MLGTLRKLRLERTIAGADSPERRCVLAMIVARVLEPGSKLATARSLAADAARDSLADTLGLQDCDEDDLYAAVDWLLKRQDAIERPPAQPRRPCVEVAPAVTAFPWRDFHARGASLRSG